MNVINENTLGSRLGASLGNGISKTLDMLSQHKLNQLAERNQLTNNMRGLEALNINPELAYLPQKLQGLAIKDQLGSGRQQDMAQALAGLLGKQQEPIAETLSRLDPQSQLKYIEQLNRQEENAKRDLYRQQQLSNQTRQIEATIASKNLATAQRGQELQERRAERQQKQLEDVQFKQQQAIDKEFAPYTNELSKRKSIAEEIIPKAEKMLNLLQSGNVNSGTYGRFAPLWVSGNESQEFSALGDDVANSLAGLSSGQQTISKIRFNKERKPNLSQTTETQIARTKDLLQEAGKVVLEGDIENYLINRNENKIPKGLRNEVSKILKRVNKIPLKGPNDENGDIIEDKKNGIRWVVSGPILRFDGLVERK